MGDEEMETAGRDHLLGKARCNSSYRMRLSEMRG